MAQAAGLAALVRAARADRELSVVCFTGFAIEALRTRPPNPEVERLLAEVDVLIDGPYVRAHNRERGLRGSDNQRVHHLTDRLRGSDHDFLDGPRTVEIRIRERDAVLVGVPSPRVLAAFDDQFTVKQRGGAR